MDHVRGKWILCFSRAARLGALAVVAALLLFSCEQPSYTTIEWEPDGDGFVQYSTNDPHYYNTAQYLPLHVEHETPTMSTVTATVKKLSGSSVDGFGIVFCYQDENNFYRLLITTEGQYNVWKVEGGTWAELKTWNDSVYLNTGMGAVNDIGVTKAVDDFTVTFNTHDVAIFNDSSSFTDGDAGPCMGIGSPSNENFRYVPADARFKMTAPAFYPP